MDPEPKSLFKIVLVGDTKTGKTCTLCQYIKGTLPKVSASTIGVEFATHTAELRNKEMVKLQIWDTAGQERYNAISQIHCRNSQGAMIFFEVNQFSTFQTIPQKIAEVRSLAGKDCVIMIIGNKIDLVEKREVSEDVARSMAKEHNCLYMEISAFKNQGIKEAFELMVEEIAKIQTIYAEAEQKQ